MDQYRAQSEFSHINFDPGDPDGSLNRLKAEFERHSPWTEIHYDPANPGGDPQVVHMVDTREKVLRLEPEMAKRLSFDGTWDNWLMYDHHPGNRPKYLLRSFAEGASLLRTVRGGEALKPQEYESLYKTYLETGNDKPLNDILKDIYKDGSGGPPSEEKLKQLRRTMDVAAKARLMHKDKTLPGLDVGTMSSADLESHLYSEFMPQPTDAEKLSGHTPEVMKQARLEAAKKAWEIQARNLMIENMTRTVKESARGWDMGVTDAEIGRLRRMNHPVPPRDKQVAAVEKSLFFGLRDMIGTTSDPRKMSFAYARSLIEPDPAKKARLLERARADGDVTLRLIEELRASGSDVFARQLDLIARDAALARLAVEPDSVLRADRQKDFAYYDHLTGILKSLPLSNETYRRFQENLDSGRYTPEYIAQRMLRAGTERAVSAVVEMGRAAGVGINDIRIYWPVMAENRLPQIEIDWAEQKFDGKALAVNLLTSSGNYDSLLQVAREYQLHGAKAAGWVALRELVMNVPYVSQASAVYDFLTTGNPQGVIMMGSAMAVPVLGQAYIFISIATTGVALVGNYFLAPLDDDLINKTYMGYIPKTEQGWMDWLLQAGWKEDEISRREHILYHIQPDVVGYEAKDKEGKPITLYLVPRYSKEKAFDLDFIESTINDDYDHLIEKGLLGGGEHWEELRAKARSDHRALFDAQRTGMFYHLEQDLITYLRAVDPAGEGDSYDVHDGDHVMGKPWLEMYTDDVSDHLLRFCRAVVEDWINANPPYEQLDENILLDTKFDNTMRITLAARMMQDLARSYEILRGAQYSKENQIRQACRDELRKRRGSEFHQGAAALEDARSQEDPEEFETLNSLGQIVSMRKDAARVPAPRVHVRPRVILQQRPGENEPKEVVQLLVSVIANDEEDYALANETKHPGPYSYKVKSYVEEDIMYAEVTILDANKTEVFFAKDESGGDLPYSWKGAIGSTKEMLQAEPPEIKLTLHEDGYVEGVEVKHSKNPDAASHELRRSRDPEKGSLVWKMDETETRLGGELVFPNDPYPAAFTGEHTWHYAAVPKTRDEHGKQMEEPEADAYASITVNLTIPKPKLKLGVDRLAGYVDPDAPTGEEDEAQKTAREAAELKSANELFISWEELKLPPPLDKTPKKYIRLQLCVTGPDGVNRLIDHYEPDEDFYKTRKEFKPGYLSTFLHLREFLPGQTYTLRARWSVGTRGGVIASDWTELAVNIPPKNVIVYLNHHNQGRVQIDVAPGTQVKIKTEKAIYSPSYGFESYFADHDADGIDESAFRRYCEDDKKKIIENFWKIHDDPGDRQGERYEELKKKLDERLEQAKESWIDSVKARTKLPSAKLGALIAWFRPYSGSEPRTEEDYAALDYVEIGKETTYTASEYGYLILDENWPRKRPGRVESTDTLFISVAYLNVTNPGPAPSYATAQWSPKDSGYDEQNEEWVHIPINGAPEDQKLEFETYASPSGEGPWSELSNIRSYKDGLWSLHYGDIHSGKRTFIRTRLIIKRPRYLGESWSAPVEIFDPDTSAKLPPGKYATFFGRKGETITVTASGSWDPVRVEGIEPYGADGIPGDKLMEAIKVLVAEKQKEKEAREQEADRNFDADLAQLKQAFRAERGREMTQEELNNYLDLIKGSRQPINPVDIMRRFKANLQIPGAPAGSLIAYYNPGQPADQNGSLSMFAFHIPDAFARSFMPAGEGWSFTFPEDGKISFLANTGGLSGYSTPGGGELTVKVEYK
jgi:hypothetical protein